MYTISTETVLSLKGPLDWLTLLEIFCFFDALFPFYYLGKVQSGLEHLSIMAWSNAVTYFTANDSVDFLLSTINENMFLPWSFTRKGSLSEQDNLCSTGNGPP